jgi:hypothetical protein
LANSRGGGPSGSLTGCFSETSTLKGFEIEHIRRSAQVDGEKDNYNILESAHFESNRVTAGIACMFMMQIIL